ncbi:hypothetical protein STCU_01035 [Strigomonas culicis]|uniref:Fungal lipase-like domain-containing protein n=1 Tax=Strigomonas culicis TaxID=28005 RepID=S9V3Q5_9TRYP|nr:hypothetical protein STCU_01035 [Strigomonas culicis]|eukprot:EPY35639.1 hypothetical protein STCU_01035 [Strigomonas culicis]
MGAHNFKSAALHYGDKPSLEQIKTAPKLSVEEVPSLQLVPPSTYAALSAHTYQLNDGTRKEATKTAAGSAPKGAKGPTAVHKKVPASSEGLPKGWQVLLDCSSFNLNREGYFAVAYVNRAARHCIIAQRGTYEVLGLRAGVWVYFDEITIQFCLAKEFSHQVHQNLQRHITTGEEWVVSYTGHSLGAVIAATRAVEEGTFAVTFESPGTRKFFEQVVGSDPRALDAALLTYLSPPNPINTLKPHCGCLVMVPSLAAALPSSLLLNPSASDGGGAAGLQTAPAAPTASYRNFFSPSRLRLPSIRAQEYMRDYMLRGVGVGVPELQQYVSKIEPVIREMIEQTYQVHSIHNICRYFAKGEEQDEEQLVLRWPSHLMQFVEYYNTSRAMEDPENQLMYVDQAYKGMLERLYLTKRREHYRLPLQYVCQEGIRFVRAWHVLTPEEKSTLPLSLLHHKTLNTIRVDGDDLVSDVLTALQAKQYLAIVTVRHKELGANTVPSSKL